MIYVLLAVAGLIFLCAIWFFITWVYDTHERQDRALKRLSDRQGFVEELVKICEQKHNEDKARIDALTTAYKDHSDNETFLKGRIGDLAEEYRQLRKEQDFMKAHQHGMDKRIAGLKREVIVTINEPVKITGPKTKKPTVTKSLLKRAGVTQ